jgi:hypothetical protein
MTVGTDSFGGDLASRAARRAGQAQVAVDATELAAGFDHAGGAFWRSAMVLLTSENVILQPRRNPR